VVTITNSCSKIGHTFVESARPVVLKVSLRVQEIALFIFESLKPYLARPFEILSDIFWPYEAIAEPEADNRSLVERILGNALKYSKNQKIEIVEVQPVMETYITAPVTALSLFLNYAFIPYCAFQNPTNNFIETAVTTNQVQDFLNYNLYRGLDFNFLKNNELLPTGDAIDQTVYQGLTALTASGLDLLTLGKVNGPLHFAVALIANLAPVQKHVLSLPPVQELNKFTHEKLDDLRESIKKPLAKKFKDMLIKKSEQHVVPTLNNAATRIKDACKKPLAKKFKDMLIKKSEQHVVPTLNCAATRIKDACELEEIGIFDNFIGNMIGTVIEKKLEENLSIGLNAVFDKTANRAADFVIDSSVGLGKKAFKVYCLNKMLVASATKIPVLGALSLVLDGGRKQTLRELSLRVAGSAIYLFTGSTFYPLLVIHIPGVIDTIMGLRKRHIKKIGLAQDPAIEVLGKIVDDISLFFGQIINSQKPVKITPVRYRGRKSKLVNNFDLNQPNFKSKTNRTNE